MKIMEGVFQMADTDHNGQITLKEFAVVVENDKPKTQVLSLLKLLAIALLLWSNLNEFILKSARDVEG